MAETAKSAARKMNTAGGRGTEEIFVPKGRKDEEQNLFISVNGVNYLIPRGKKSTVPSFVAEEYRRSLAAQEALDAYIDQKLSEAQKPLG